MTMYVSWPSQALHPKEGLRLFAAKEWHLFMFNPNKEYPAQKHRSGRIALFLSLLTILLSLWSFASAATASTATTLINGLQATSARTVTMTADITVSSRDIQIVCTGGIILDLNGHTLTLDDATLWPAGGKLTIRDSGSTGKIVAGDSSVIDSSNAGSIIIL